MAQEKISYIESEPLFFAFVGQPVLSITLALKPPTTPTLKSA